MEIIQCDHSHRDVWNEFVQEHGGGSIYHRFEWRTVNSRCFNHESAYLAAVEDGAFAGVLPIVRLKSRIFGNIGCSLPFVNYGGAISKHPAAERALLAGAKDVAESWKVGYLEIRSRTSVADLPQTDHKVSMSVALNHDPERLFAGYKTGQRQEIRRAAKHGYEVRFGTELLPDFYAVLAESWRNHGTPFYSIKYFEEIVGTFPGRVRVAVAYLGDQPVAAALDGLSTATIEGMWMGAKPEHRAKGVNYVLYWELIKHACLQGFQQFHLGRSTVDSGGETFKKKWNAEAVPLYWQYVLRTRRDIPQLNVTNPKYRLAIKAWQKLPIPVTQVIGPLIARSIP